MFRLHKKLKYMVFGGVLPLTGFMFGSMKNNTEAQFGSETIDELTVRKLSVTEEVILYNGSQPVVFIQHDENGGKVSIAGRGAKGAILMSIGEDGGVVGVYSKEGAGGVLISNSDNMSGLLNIFSVDRKLIVDLGGKDDAGLVRVKSKAGEGEVILTTLGGDGVVVTRDELGEIITFPDP